LRNVLEHARPRSEHFDAQLHGVTAALGVGVGVPVHRQAALHGMLVDVGAILAMDGDAMVARATRPTIAFRPAGDNATAEAVVEDLKAKDPRCRWCRGWPSGFGLLAPERGQILVGEHRGGGFAGQPISSRRRLST